MSMCVKCGGFKGEVGKVYGYAGKWCDCWTWNNHDVRHQMKQAVESQPLATQPLTKISDLEILIEFNDRKAMADEIKNLRDLNNQLKARFEKETGVYYINGRKFVPVEMFDQVVEVLQMVQDNTKMPHQHTDPQLRLYCLAERAEEVLKKVEV